MRTHRKAPLGKPRMKFAKIIAADKSGSKNVLRGFYVQPRRG